jgi:hypothetical protein
MDCVTAIFVSNVKILASVRLGGNHSNIRIRIPTSEKFIHSVYIASAENFYYDPECFDDVLERNNIEKIRSRIGFSIEETISSMIPIQNILQEYLCNTFTEHVQSNVPSSPPPPQEKIGDILTGDDIIEPLPPTPNPPTNYKKEYETPKKESNDNISEKSSISDLFSIGGDLNSLGDIDSIGGNEKIDNSENVKEINIGGPEDNISFGEDKQDDSKNESSENSYKESSKDSSFNPLGFLGFGGSDNGDGGSDNEGSSKLDETDFNFFDDTKMDF